MTFTYPLGLLGLIGIPIIIIIYILQSKYTEQTVTSTYLWKLSEKFLKRKNPLSGLAGIISLILQILTVAAISLAMAHPIITLPGAANNYSFVLDASGSMAMEEGGVSRFDMAKEKISDVIEDSKDGSSYSLISVSGSVVKIFEGQKNKDAALMLLSELEVGDSAADYSDMLSAAQGEFDRDSSALVYLVTDKSYKTHENIEIISVGNEKEENYALFDVEYSHTGSVLSASFEVISYTSDKELSLSLLVDGKVLKEEKISLKSGERVKTTLQAPVLKFDLFEVKINDSDGYMTDNSVTVHNLKSDKTYSTLIVSETGFFLKAAIDALVDSQIDVVDPDKYAEVTEKYGLYIFDSFSPEVLPDGTVWLINSDKSIEGAGFGVRGKVELPLADTIDKSKSTSTSVRRLLEGISGEEIYISRYVKYSGMYLNFSTLFSYDSNPLVFVGSNALGNRQVVFGFDLHESDFALSTDFIILLQNLIEYSFPDVIDDANYTVGEEALVNILTNAESYKAESPSGKDIYVDMSAAVATVLLEEVGTYTVTVNVGGKEIPYKIYSAAHPAESEPASEEEDFSLSGEKTYQNIDGEYDALALLFIILAVLFIADWGVYCYEKYQLR